MGASPQTLRDPIILLVRSNHSTLRTKDLTRPPVATTARTKRKYGLYPGSLDHVVSDMFYNIVFANRRQLNTYYIPWYNTSTYFIPGIILRTYIPYWGGGLPNYRKDPARMCIPPVPTCRFLL